MRTLRVEEGIIEDDKLRKQARYGVVENAQLSTTGKIYEEPNDDYFVNYLRWAGRGSSEEILKYLISLNPLPVSQLQKMWQSQISYNPLTRSRITFCMQLEPVKDSELKKKLVVIQNYGDIVLQQIFMMSIEI